MIGSAGRRLVSNSGWNLLGHGAGLAAALIAIPILIRNLGTEIFGVFSIYMAVVGYFGLLDLGIGRAVTARVADHDSRGEEQQMVGAIATATMILLLLGAAACVLVLLSRDWIVQVLVKDQVSAVQDSANSLAVLAITVPVVLISSVYRGALEGLRAFRQVSRIAVPIGVLMFAAPAVVSNWSPSLTSMMATVLAVRIGSLVLFVRSCDRRMAALRSGRPSREQVTNLLTTGGWMTVSNAVSPLMTSLDRVLIGSHVSLTAVTHYVTPYEMATRVLLGSSSISSAAYPEFVRMSSGDLPASARRRHFVRTSALALLAALLPATIVFAFAHAILSAWISASLADASYQILRVLLVGVVINGASYIPFALIQGYGRADVTAKFHLFELFLYVPALIASLELFGAIGAAYAWVGRVALDAVLLFGYALRLLR